MQHKNKKKSQSHPIVPKHAASHRAAAGSGLLTQQQQQGHKNAHAANGSVQHSTAGQALLGKRRRSTDHQVAQGPQQQPGMPGGEVEVVEQQHKRMKLQKQPLQHQGLQKHSKPPQLQQQQPYYLLEQQQQQQQKCQQIGNEHSKQQALYSKHQKQLQHQQQQRKKRKQQQRSVAGPPGAMAVVDEGATGKGSAQDTAVVPETAMSGPTAAAAADAKPWNMKRSTAISSNWQALQQQLKQQAAAAPKRPHKHHRIGSNASGAAKGSSGKQISAVGHNRSVTPIVAMDCEMVGVGPGGERDSLARISIVNASGQELYDSYVAQKEPVTDYRTWVSGITPANLQGAPDISLVQEEVTQLLRGRVLVGHGLKKDLSVLMLSHPRKNIRDTAKYPPFMFSKSGKRRPRALKVLAQQELGISIQEGQHSSVDDARAALYLYQKHASVWEKALKTPQGLKQLPNVNRRISKKRVESYSLRDVKDDPLADL